MRAIGFFIALFALWAVLSGFTLWWLLALGVTSAAFATYIAMRMDESDGSGLEHVLRAELVPGYLLWLVWQIVKSNIDVSRLILARDIRLSPEVRWVPADQRTELGRVVYANSITLTPGTLSIDLTDDAVEVHALIPSGLDDLEEGEMNRRVCALEEAAR